MKILGLGGSDHDLSSCLLEDGKVVCAIEEERISGEKHGRGVRSCMLKSVDYCMGENHYDDIDLFITSDLFHPRLTSRKPFLDKMIKVNHHYAHLASAYYQSGFDEASWVIIDGGGSFAAFNAAETITMGYVKHGEFITLQKIIGKLRTDISQALDQTNSIGSMYDFFNLLCGFKPFEAGKLMGLSSYGKPVYVDELKKKCIVDINKAGDIVVDINLGPPTFKHYEKLLSMCRDEKDNFSMRADLACSAQCLLEECIFKIMNALYCKTKCSNLCYAGGVAYNSVFNGKIKKSTPFTNVFIPPSAGDSGIAIGAAFYGYYNIMGSEFKPGRQLVKTYTGRSYSRQIIADSLKKHDKDISFENVEISLYEKASQSLTEGKIIGWFQGNSEFGPRALGNRSILADPRKADMKDIINARVKFREAFRPFAPIILEERVNEYFDTDFPHNPFMLYVGEVKEDKKKVIPAVTHVDGSARLQTISKEINPELYQLLQVFTERTAVPVLLNTSFNTKGKPIVETPEDAIKCFLDCDLDELYIGTYKVIKNK